MFSDDMPNLKNISIAKFMNIVIINIGFLVFSFAYFAVRKLAKLLNNIYIKFVGPKLAYITILSINNSMLNNILLLSYSAFG